MRGGAFIFALCAAKHPRPLKKRRPEISPVGRRVSTGFRAFCTHSLSAIRLRSLQNSGRASRRANEIAGRRLRAAAKTQSAGKSRSTGRSARPLRRAAIQSAFLPARNAVRRGRFHRPRRGSALRTPRPCEADFIYSIAADNGFTPGQSPLSQVAGAPPRRRSAARHSWGCARLSAGKRPVRPRTLISGRAEPSSTL